MALRRATVIEKIICSSYYGSPRLADCDDAAEHIRDILGTDASEYDWRNTLYVFLDIGAAPFQGPDRVFHLPIFFNSGECTIAIFRDESISRVSKDFETWFDLFTATSYTRQVCVENKHMGGMITGLGAFYQSINTYTYARGSEFDRMLKIKLSCPTCGSQGCAAAQNHNEKCSNNPQVKLNPLPHSDPRIPATLPKQADQTTQDVQTYCGVECKSQGDCRCTGFFCSENLSVAPWLRESSKSCVYMASMASSWTPV